jgi:hypothetical protein
MSEHAKQRDGIRSRITAAARPRPWLRVSLPPRVARFLTVAGARPAPEKRDGK